MHRLERAWTVLQPLGGYVRRCGSNQPRNSFTARSASAATEQAATTNVTDWIETGLTVQRRREMIPNDSAEKGSFGLGTTALGEVPQRGHRDARAQARSGKPRYAPI